MGPSLTGGEVALSTNAPACAVVHTDVGSAWNEDATLNNSSKQRKVWLQERVNTSVQIVTETNHNDLLILSKLFCATGLMISITKNVENLVRESHYLTKAWNEFFYCGIAN